MNKIIYLDAAASCLKPESVICAQDDFLRNKYANAGRGICARAAAVDDMVVQSRRIVADFINANPTQVVFTNGATDGLNRVVRILQNSNCLGENVVVGVSDLDHHSARLPWVAAAEQKLCRVHTMALDDGFNIDVNKLPRMDVCVITAMSNVMGVPQNVAAIICAAREKNPDVITIVDAAQYVAHLPIDAAGWDADFVCFSGHKIGADTGVGIMYVKNPNRWTPDKFGGGMVNRVVDGANMQFSDAPNRFEAGTLPLTQICGLGVAIDYMKNNRPNLDLIKFMYDELAKNPRIKILTSRDAALLTFVVDGMHVLDFGALVGASGVCIRVGNMCATWIHNALNVPGTARISVGPWNTIDDARDAVRIINSVVK